MPWTRVSACFRNWRTSLNPDGLQGGSAWESSYWSGAECTQHLYYAYPADTELSRLRAGVYAADNLALSAVATVKVYDGPVFSSDGGVCFSTAYNGRNGELLTLDRRMDVLAMPLVVETAL